jgi:hypothetical protein
LVGKVEVLRAAVCLAKYRNGFDPHLLASSNDSKGDLATIGDENSFEHDELPLSINRECQF